MSTELNYWPYCGECHQPFAFDIDAPLAYCKCGTTEWGNPRPAAYVRNPAGQPDDLRAAGYTVMIHNDMVGDEPSDPKVYWCLYKRDGGKAMAGYGETDAEALDMIRAKLLGGK